MLSIPLMLPIVIACTSLLCLLGALPSPAQAHSDAAMFGAPTATHHHDDDDADPARLYPATVSIDPREMVNVVIKINARIANLRNVYAGKRVARGEVLGEMESAELETVQATYLGLFSNMAAVQAFSMTSEEKMVDARMILLWRGMSEGDVKRLEATGHPLKLIKIKAPAAGYLASLNVVKNQILNAGSQGGQYATSGTTIATIAKPEAIVVEADLPAPEATALKPGQLATVYVTDPGKGRVAVPARVQRVYAFVNPANQRQRVRLQISGMPERLGLLNGRAAMVSFQEQVHAH
jgi:hypothetical protein